MNRPWVIWTVLGLCALLIVGAMAWSTNKVLVLEGKQALAESSAELEERIRLSLSRMDIAASGLLVLENQRPPHHFKAYFEPEDVFTNKFQVVGKGIVVQPSPLLPELPEFVRLHFEIDAATREVNSPQVPTGNERDSAEGNGIQRTYLDTALDDLNALKRLLDQPSLSETGSQTKLDEICTACVTVNEVWGREGTSWNILKSSVVQQKEAWVKEARGDNRAVITRGKQFQQEVAIIEKSKRAEVLNDNYERALPKQSQNLRNGSPVQSQQIAEEVQRQQSSVQWPVAQSPFVQQRAGSAGYFGNNIVELPMKVTPFQPVWLAEELLIVRQVAIAGKLRYQGAWLRADKLSAYLLSAASDLLPDAGLEPILEISARSLPGTIKVKLDELSNDPLSLVTLPWRLRAGELPVAANVGWSALRISLVVGWVALVLALLASAVLVRGVMKLSDRRATFVSSVTHELRTPLTTFHLYSDMLVEGMVKDEKKKKEYLTTMRREAERLNHLVENVLAYSRVERGSARTQHQRVSLASLLERMQPRLTERVCKDEAVLAVESMSDAAQVLVETDLTAVEQIVFNLVDNACKYGLPDEGERIIHLRASNGGKIARIEVCDEGGGIARADEKKLFRPFHKSARDAAHSKPGVGLGLALSRRLARELGGELRIDCERGRGACFVLELPIAKKG
jgi:signal transduction histidine kinase